MKYQLSNQNFNAVLNELAEEYKDLLIEVALKQNNELDIENVNISEITKIDIETKERLKNRGKNQKTTRISNLVSMLGMMYALFGLMLIMISEVESNVVSEPMSIVALICVFIGCIIAIFGMMMRLFLNKKNIGNKKTTTDYEIQVINKWRIIESLIYQLSPENDKLSLRSVINNLEQTNFISKEELKTINRLMMLRNKILHKSPGSVEITDEIKEVLDKSQKIINKLTEFI